MIDSSQNVVLVSIDSLRADHCGFMGYDRDTTPNLDRLANNGTVYKNAIAPGPSTPESMPVIFTGQHLSEGNGSFSTLEAQRRDIRNHLKTWGTIAERFSRAGYATAAFTPNPFLSRHFGFDRGFDHFQDFMGRSMYDRVFQGFLRNDLFSSTVRPILNWWQQEEVFKPWTTFYDEIAAWISEADRPYFLWVMLMDVHNPYLSSDEYRSQSKWKTFQANWRFWRDSHETPFSESIQEQLVTAYDDAVRHADAFVGQLWNDLREDDPVFVVHADHGEAFGEHGIYGHEPYLFEENIHVPLVVANEATSRVVEKPISLMRLPVLLGQGGGSTGSRFLPSEFSVARTRQGEKLALRGQHWKFIRSNQNIWACNLSKEVEALTPIGDRETQELVNWLLRIWKENHNEIHRVGRAIERTTRLNLI